MTNDEGAVTPLGLLTPEEIAKAKLKARANVDSKKKADALAALIAEETQRIHAEENSITGKPDMDELVWITIDIPEYGDRLSIDGVQYLLGQTYKVKRHVANSMRESMHRMWDHQAITDGKSVNKYRKPTQLHIAKDGSVSRA